MDYEESLSFSLLSPWSGASIMFQGRRMPAHKTRLAYFLSGGDSGSERVESLIMGFAETDAQNK